MNISFACIILQTKRLRNESVPKAKRNLESYLFKFLDKVRWLDGCFSSHKNGVERTKPGLI